MLRTSRVECTAWVLVSSNPANVDYKPNYKDELYVYSDRDKMAIIVRKSADKAVTWTLRTTLRKELILLLVRGEGRRARLLRLGNAIQSLAEGCKACLRFGVTILFLLKFSDYYNDVVAKFFEFSFIIVVHT